ncbi:Alpha-ribazole phosphatase [compost metagenome]
MNHPGPESRNENAAVRRRRCYLVRHGHVDYFDADGRPFDPRQVPLSPRGVEQASALGRVLGDSAFDRAICSVYPRTRQTLELVLGERSMPIEEWAALKEIRGGRLREIPAECYRHEVSGAYRRAAEPGAAFLRGEPWVDFQQRVLGAFFELLADPHWNSALLVTHDAVNRVLLAWASGAGLAGIAAYEQDNACLNVLDVDTQGGQVAGAIIRTLNFTPYDPHKSAIRHTVMENLHRSMDPSAVTP